MKYKLLILIFVLSIFLQGYQFKYKVPVLDASCNAPDHNNQGIEYMNMGYYNAALSEFKIAISLSPNAPTSSAYYNNLGLAYMNLGILDAAKPCFEKAISLNPVFMEYYKNLITLYSQKGQLDNLLNIYKKQINADSRNSQAYFMAGLICREQGDINQATTYLKEYIVLEKDNLLSRAAKQMIYEMQSNEL